MASKTPAQVGSVQSDVVLGRNKPDVAAVSVQGSDAPPRVYDLAKTAVDDAQQFIAYRLVGPFEDMLPVWPRAP